jgi:DNA-binding NarL/FixJ family response regulator
VLYHLRTQFPQLPVVIVTAQLCASMEHLVREMGAMAVLSKELPCDPIVQAITHLLQAGGRPAEGGFARVVSAQAEEGVQPARILVVDDEPAVCVAMQEFLALQGYRVTTALSSAEALTVLQQEPPDLILLDLYMPGMSGMKLLRHLHERQSPVGVIVLTASRDEALLAEALQLGASEILLKPADLAEMDLAIMLKLALSAHHKTYASQGHALG